MPLLLFSLLASQDASILLRVEPLSKVYRPGEPMPMRFSVENTGDRETEFEEPADYLEGLEVRDPADRVVKAPGKLRDSKRRYRLDARGFFGRTLDVSGAFAAPEDKEGLYTFRWQFQNRISAEVRVFVIRDYRAVIDTNFGIITVELLADVAPHHVVNFAALIRKGFYADAKFYRIVPGFAMQGGQAAKSRSLPPVAAEFCDRKHEFGTVSMARLDAPDSATSEFFICFGPAPHLDRAYTVFGAVVEGQDFVREIERVKTDHSPCRECKQTLPAKATQHCGAHHEDRPVSDVIIRNITLTVRKK